MSSLVSPKVTRREALRLLGLGALAAATAACAPATPKPTEAPQPTAAAQEAPTAVPEATEAPTAAPATKVDLEFVMNDSPGWADAVNKVMKMFMDQHPNITVKFTPIDFGELKTVLTPRFAAKDPPSTLLCDCFWPWVQQGMIRDLNPLIDRDQVDLTAIADLGAGLLFGKPDRYGLPFDFTGSVIAYNKTLCDKYGVSYPKQGWTTDDLRDAAIKLTRDQNDRSPLDAGFEAKNIRTFGVQLSNSFFWGAIVKMWGGTFWSDDGRTCLLDDPKAVESFVFFNDLACRQHALYGPQPTQQAGAGDPFVSSLVAMTIEGEWQLALYKDIADFDWDVAAWPKGPRAVSQYGGSDAIGIPKDWKYVDEAWEFIKYWIWNKEAALITGAIMPPALNEAGLADEALQPRIGKRGPSMENTRWAYTNMRQHSDCSIYYMSTHAEEWQPLLNDMMTSLLTLCDRPAEALVKETTQQITEILRKP